MSLLWYPMSLKPWSSVSMKMICGGRLGLKAAACSTRKRSASSLLDLASLQDAEVRGMRMRSPRSTNNAIHFKSSCNSMSVLISLGETKLFKLIIFAFLLWARRGGGELLLLLGCVAKTPRSMFPYWPTNHVSPKERQIGHIVQFIHKNMRF